MFDAWRIDFARAQIVWLCGSLLLVCAPTSWAQTAQAEEAVHFNIPAQALAAALEQYGSATGRNALYNSNLIADRRSTAVQGDHPADDALAILLEGTGLSARRATSSSYLLLPAPDNVATVPPP